MKLRTSIIASPFVFIPSHVHPTNMQPSPAGAPLLIYGAGGMARELAWLADTALPPRRVLGFIDDAALEPGRELHGVRLYTLAEAAREWPGAAFVAGVGSPALRARLAARAEQEGLVPTTLVDRDVRMSHRVVIGEGAVVCAGSIITTDVQIGRHVQVNTACTIAHDAVLEDFATLAPGVHVSGAVVLQRGSYVGTGASIINGTAADPLVIGAGATVGAGAVVTKSVPPGVTVVGVPARPRGSRTG